MKTVPKAQIKITCLVITATINRKGIGLTFPNLDTERESFAGSSAVTQTNSETSAKALGRVVFSL